MKEVLRTILGLIILCTFFMLFTYSCNENNKNYTVLIKKGCIEKCDAKYKLEIEYTPTLAKRNYDYCMFNCKY